ncbi:MAG: hypothetical protein EXS13_00525 [Planctomycetes bacterium]|nr:hypothetical protein [Planctomycetota bacterium]
MKSLLTELDLRRLAHGARVVVDRDTLVTPSARDYALQAGIELCEASRASAGQAAKSAAKTTCCSACAAGGSGGAGTCASGSGAACGGAAPSTPALGEGDWLVQVRDGKVTARQIAP